METSKTKTKSLTIGVGFNMKPTIGKTACLLLMLTALTLFIGCSTTETNEPTWNDMYEVKTYEVKTETYTNEIITTVFICRQVETNKVMKVEKEVEDFGGYEFEYSETNTKNFVDSEKPFGDTQIEFQCVDGSCEVKER